MKYSSLKAKKKTALPGRKFIIAVIVVVSALSFSLGYFVGGAGDKGKQPGYRRVAAPEREVVPQVQEQPTPGNTPQVADATQSIIAASGDSPSLPVQPSAQKEPAGHKVETDNSHQDNIKYTIQVGAFKNLKEAETLKQKLETKGYKAYVKKYAKSKNPKLYKVRIGEFAVKEEGAALALKMKNEGFKAFVTLKNEDARGDKNSSHPGAAKKESLR
jgi:cell division septation protein DedD